MTPNIVLRVPAYPTCLRVFVIGIASHRTQPISSLLLVEVTMGEDQPDLLNTVLYAPLTHDRHVLEYVSNLLLYRLVCGQLLGFGVMGQVVCAVGVLTILQFIQIVLEVLV